MTDTPGPTTLTLKRKVVHEGKDYLFVELDEPSLGGIEAYEVALAAKSPETAAMAAMLAYEWGWPIEAVRKIKVSDFTAIAEAMAPFVEGLASGPTGAASPPT